MGYPSRHRAQDGFYVPIAQRIELVKLCVRALTCMTSTELTRLIADGLTQREIAAKLDTSHTNVRYWLQKYGLRTRPHRSGCAAHGVTPCPKCKRGSAAQVTARRRNLKQMMVDERGGRCESPTCPVSRTYAFELGDLDFHHRVPATKVSQLANWAGSEAAFRVEAAKCDVLCALCHRRAERAMSLSSNG